MTCPRGRGFERLLKKICDLLSGSSGIRC